MRLSACVPAVMDRSCMCGKGSQGFLLTMIGPKVNSLADHGLAKEEALAALILPRL